MKEAEIQKIESALKVQLPKYYRNFLLKHSEDLRAASEKLPLRALLHYDADSVISDNEQVRNTRDPFVNQDTEMWPSKYLVAGNNGAGDMWCVDLTSDGREIWYFDHEGGGFEKSHDSFDEYMREIKKDLRHPQFWQYPRPS